MRHGFRDEEAGKEQSSGILSSRQEYQTIYLAARLVLQAQSE